MVTYTRTYKTNYSKFYLLHFPFQLPVMELSQQLVKEEIEKNEVDTPTPEVNGKTGSVSDVIVSVGESEEGDSGRVGYWVKVRGNRSLMVDVISRVLFPLGFIVFNITYWITYWGMS